MRQFRDLFNQLACFDCTTLRKTGAVYCVEADTQYLTSYYSLTLLYLLKVFSVELLATLLLTAPSGSYSLLGDNVCTGHSENSDITVICFVTAVLTKCNQIDLNHSRSFCHKIECCIICYIQYKPIN